MSDTTLRQQPYSYFLTEAQDLLRSIEQDLLSLREERSPAKVHSLMRAAHTLKGAAASVGFDTIKTISHSLEDVFKALYKPEVDIDAELEALLFEGYECLRSPLMMALNTDRPPNHGSAECLARAEVVFKQLRTKLGKHFDPGAAIPTSAELGFDITRSLFETGVRERLEELAIAVSNGSPQQISETLQTQAEVFLGLSESLNLPGFGAIAQASLKALKVNPEQSVAIAQAALADLRQGQIAVLSGDRRQGGAVSEALKRLTHRTPVNAPQSRRTTLSHREPPASKARSMQSALQHSQRSWHRFLQFLNRPLWSAPDAGVVKSNPVTVRVDNNVQEDGQAQLDIDSIQSALEELGSLDLSPTSEAAGSSSATQGFELWDDEPPATILPPKELQPSPQQAGLEQAPLQASLKPQPMTQHVETPPLDHAPQLEKGSAQMPTVRVELEHLESLNYTTSELLIHQNQQMLQDEHLHLVVRELTQGLKQHQRTMAQLQEWADRQLTLPEPSMDSHRARLAQMEDGLNIKFDTLELDQHNEVHELLQSAVEELVPLELEVQAMEALARQANLARNKQGRLLGYLRDDLMLARMIPIGAVLNRLPRIVQQLTETYGKQVELQLSGTQVLVDKAVAERLFDPLLHLIRNAFDHGIESADLRHQHRKPAGGRIIIRVSQQGNRTLIDVQDDGGGLDLKRICQRGFELKKLSSNQVEQFSQAELLNLLFEPGFSTAKQVNELSGRGVGLDVVRSHVQFLQGNLTVASELNRGTTFSLHLPLTLMSARLLVCQSGQAIYGFLSDEIDRILAPTAEQFEMVGSTRVFRWQQGEEEYPVPVHQISQLMHYATMLPSAESTRNGLPEIGTLSTPLLLMRRQEEWVGLEVDHLIGEQELVIRPMGTTLTPPSYVYGCSVLGDGRLILVVDGVAIVQQLLLANDLLRKESSADLPLQQPHLRSADIPANLAPSSPVQTSQCVLVIDDSITVRQALTFTLQDAGYDVIQAQDGLDAIAQLQQHPDIQLITCDVEMPRLNGFEFLMRYSQESGLKQIPVIMLTSRSNEKHQQLAVQLGASAYMTKPFAEEQLLSLVKRLIKSKEAVS
ncbi:hybrid sensor histidine kinase/response regulator [Myxacorys almedinensis]|uniref:histidine kinase n=1 Tax=Myxacorys almedinensis A TaxID=2690445 RepID=A0A8J8CKM1_9CYAN|nr:hybrid sensor histidine kinase/response regulator [Myxacorys almedinensis]NDJ19684.1 response regulator [Myxacorys almedinensis A]